MAQGRPANIANPNELFDWIETVADASGTGFQQNGTLTAVVASTVDGTYGTEEAAVINSLRVTLNQVISQLGLDVA